jgi:FkbM family methyltransferase
MAGGPLRGALRRLGHAGLLPDAVWRRLPAIGQFEVQLPGGESFVYEGTPADAVARAAMWLGWDGYEHETIGTFVSLARNARTFLDIGANTGLFSLLALASNPRLQAVAFEPTPMVRALLERNIQLNGWGERCEVHAEAVSDFVGETKFHRPVSQLPTSSSLDVDGFRGYEGNLIDVPVTTIDALYPTRDDVDLAKIDIEGFEDRALDGMREVLRRCRPRVILEILPDGPLEAIERVLSEENYRWWHMRQSGLVAQERIRPDERERWKNFIAAHEDDRIDDVLV